MTRFGTALKSIGPGILFAGAAIGGSHLVQSTRAGANYGFALISLVVLINLLKYPFFEFAHRYTAATGESILVGYRRLGRLALIAFLFLAILAAIMNAAAVTLVAAGLLGLITGSQWSLFASSIIIVVVCAVILLIGQYAVLDKVMKIMVALLGLTTIIAVSAAAGHKPEVESIAVTPNIWNLAGFSFLLALMGWMPAPIDVSVWPSLWSLERSKQTKHTPSLRETLLDFNIGYGITTVLALTFVSLGALVMFGSGESFSSSGIKFSLQLVSLYTKMLGEWSYWIIAVLAFTTMFSTTLAVMDGYTRTLKGSLELLFPDLERHPRSLYWGICILLFSIALVIIGQFLSSMTGLVDLATILAFLAAPALAYLNYRTITSDAIKGSFRPPRWLLILSWIGMVFLTSFTVIYIFWRFFYA